MANRHLLILGCSETKREAAGLLPAIERYDGSPYRVVRAYLREHQWPSNLSIGILSAKYGLVGGFTGIADYDLRMTKDLATDWAESCGATLTRWAREHDSVHLSLGKDYLPALRPVVDDGLRPKVEVFPGGIGRKLQQIKNLLQSTAAPARAKRTGDESGSGGVRYFLPDWDDLLDPAFDFVGDSFSKKTRQERGDKHCSILMQPERMCDGILVSLAQHVTSKGPLRRILGHEAGSLAPVDLRMRFGLSEGQTLFGDCGAFSYVNEDEPAISVDQAVALYNLHGFDFGASVDHIPVLHTKTGTQRVNLSEDERQKRVTTTVRNAEEFIGLVRQRRAGFTPVGTIQALTAEGYAKTAAKYHELGYRHLAVGGLVPLTDHQVEAVVTAVMEKVAMLSPRPWVHLFGVFRPKLQVKFRELKVDSFDSATYFRKAWLRSDQNYLSTDGSWYAALRVPMTSDGRTKSRLLECGDDISVLEAQEVAVLSLLGRYDQEAATLQEVLDAVIEYDQKLTRSAEAQSLRERYRLTLKERPWLKCQCPFCASLGLQIAVFRGSNRNKRRGAHNTLMLYKQLRQP